MKIVREVIVFDAADMRAESTFWAGIYGGHVFEDEAWHSVIDAAGNWRIGVQLKPDHVPPGWPEGTPQQLHLDLHVDDPRAAHEQVTALGARLLQPSLDLDADEGHQVYADPAGHPFCVGWGHPSQAALTAFVAERLGTAVEPDESLNAPPGSRTRTLVTSNISVTGDGTAIQQNSPGAQQTVTNTITIDQREQLLRFADALAAAIPDLGLDDEASNLPDDLRDAADTDRPRVLRRVIQATIGALAASTVTSLSKPLVLDAQHLLQLIGH